MANEPPPGTEPNPALTGSWEAPAPPGPRRASRRLRGPRLDERDALILKLIGFRRDLTTREQAMLDAMAVAAFCERPEDVEALGGRPLGQLPPARDDSAWLRAYSLGDP